jgi:hypothetical protein
MFAELVGRTNSFVCSDCVHTSLQQRLWSIEMHPPDLHRTWRSVILKLVFPSIDNPVKIFFPLEIISETSRRIVSVDVNTYWIRIFPIHHASQTVWSSGTTGGISPPVLLVTIVALIILSDFEHKALYY